MANTSQGPAITSATAPKAPVGTPISSPHEVQAHAAKVAAAAVDSIVAAPLIEPDFVNLKPTNPGIRFRWILHTLYKQDGGQSILRFEQAKAQGYAVATKADIVNPPMAYERDGGTKYINGDLILMKIDRRKYDGAILFREQQAAKAMLSTGNKGKQMLREELSGQSRSQAAKVQTFDPTADLAQFAKEGAIETLDDE